MKICWIRNIV